MSEHRRKQQSTPGSTPPGARRGPQQAPPGRQGTPPPRRTAAPQGSRSQGFSSEPRPAPSEPRPTRAEMRRSAQGKGGGGRRATGSGPAGPAGPRPKRFLDYPRWGKNGVRRWIPSFKQILSGALIMFAAVVGFVGYAYATTAVPKVNPSSEQQNNVFYWADGTVMTKTGSVNRQIVHIQDVPKVVQEDFMAAEDESFETNSGIDPMSILRAVKNMATGGDIQSGSTITQQWVKNSVLANTQQTLSRKFKEIIISAKIGRGYYSKPQVMEGYLNSNYYGRGANGIEAAAQAYYGVHASQLTLAQGAFIAATVNQPSYYQDISTDKGVQAAALARWNYVLNRMVANNWMTAADRAKLTPDKFPMPKPWIRNATLTGQIGYLVDTATNYVEQHSTPKVTDSDFAAGGFQVYTTFKKSDVTALAAAVDKVTKEHIDPKKRPNYDSFFQTGAASIDPGSGAIVSLYGGPGQDKGHDINNANSAGVPVGSTFKPVDMATALEKGAILTPGSDVRSPITPDSKFNGNNLITIRNQAGQLLTNPNGSLFHQRNDNNNMPGFITLRTAMNNSVNTPYVQLGEDVGYANVKAMAVSLGLGFDPNALSGDTAGFFIGTSTPSAIRMANVYATLDNGGTFHEPYSVTKVVRTGTDLTSPVLAKPTSTPVMSPSTANTINSMLQDVVKYGTATAAQAIGRPAAGKTGTTDDYKSAWFIGYTPQLATAVAMFREDPKHPGMMSMVGTGTGQKTTFYGGALPTEVWTDYMSDALKGQSVMNFPPAPSLPKGANESGAPTPTPTPTNTVTATTAPPTTAPPTATSTPSNPFPTSTQSCLGVGGIFCPPDPSSTATDTSGASPTPSRSKKGQGSSSGGTGFLG
ncbi:transglycosylase domain-containing protein [Streptacidiphilus cavernicola]|uniref:Transglycosylase domain-containing protein n=1 Tax=Streptacidiphilus cavernicola TaxID=3342716 RepID=A0ABV6VV58_9ACTN